MTSAATAKEYELDQEAWWVQRWVDLLNQYRFKKRLERGRRYAREGNILDLQYKNAKVTALVQGTAPEPYQLSIWLDAFTDEDWDYVIATLSEQAAFSAQLLAGDMPGDIEAVFTANGLSLFPFTLGDVHSRCSCPDPQNPCKHIAAVYYQLGDFFREDPFVLFQLRGRSRDQLLTGLRQRRQRQLLQETPGEVAPPDPGPGADTSDGDPVLETQAQAPSANLDQRGDRPQVEGEQSTATLALADFWHYDQPLDSSLVVVTPAGETALDVLNPIPLPANDARVVMGYLRSLYPAVGQWAAMRALNPTAEG